MRTHVRFTNKVKLDKNGLAVWLVEHQKRARGRCECCRAKFKKNEPIVDHDHRTGRPRALLCHRCNHLEGVTRGADFRDKIRYLKDVISWMKAQVREERGWKPSNMKRRCAPIRFMPRTVEQLDEEFPDLGEPEDGVWH